MLRLGSHVGVLPLPTRVGSSKRLKNRSIRWRATLPAREAARGGDSDAHARGKAAL